MQTNAQQQAARRACIASCSCAVFRLFHSSSGLSVYLRYQALTVIGSQRSGNGATRVARSRILAAVTRLQIPRPDRDHPCPLPPLDSLVRPRDEKLGLGFLPQHRQYSGHLLPVSTWPLPALFPSLCLQCDAPILLPTLSLPSRLSHRLPLLISLTRAPSLADPKCPPAGPHSTKSRLVLPSTRNTKGVGRRGLHKRSLQPTTATRPAIRPQGFAVPVFGLFVK